MNKFIFLLILFPLTSWAEVFLPEIFSDNMVLQQNSDIKIWGWADPGEKVEIKVAWLDEPIYTKGDRNAQWSVSVKTPSGSKTPYTMTVKGDKNSISLENILLGEVWICAGQSNMEWSAAHGVKDALDELPHSHDNSIRFFDMPKSATSTPQNNIRGTWTICDSTTLRNFSAVGYFFGKKLKQSLDVPIGLIDVAWGGSYIESWIPAELVNLYPQTKFSTNIMPPSGHWPNQEGYIFNAMVYPIIKYGMAGVIWYQGESNTHYPSAYYQLEKLMIDSWRGLWEKDFPFYYVQIAPYNYRGDSTNTKAALVREMQSKAMTIPNTGMVVTTDLVDNIDDVHPIYKQEVGNRLANWALANTYNKSVDAYRSPEYRSMKIIGNKIHLSFDYVSLKGLMLKGEKLTEFEIAAANGSFEKADAEILNGEVVVWSNSVKKPVAVRFAFSNNPVPNLYDQNGLPVVPFRTDSW